MAFWLNDISALLADFGVTATLADGRRITGIFDADYVGVGDIPVESSGPAFTLASADVTGNEIAIGSALTIEGDDYTVRSVQPDGTGVTVLRLEAE